MGLLLVTKLLPSGSPTAIREVITAVGLDFLNRLLLPLTTHPHQPYTPEQQQQQLMTCSLALSILSAAATAAVPEVQESLLPLTPTLIQIIKHGGITPLLSADTSNDSSRGTADRTSSSSSSDRGTAYSSRSSSSSADPAADLQAVADALECCIAVASASQGAECCITADGIAAAVASLHQAVASLTSLGSETQATAAAGAGAAAAGEAGGAAAAAGAQTTAAGAGAAAGLRYELPVDQVMHLTQLSVHFLACLLNCPSQPRSLLLKQYPHELAEAVHALAPIFSGQDSLAVDAAPSAAAAAGGTGGSVDAAMLQLDALHALLLLLPLPEDSEVAHILQQQLQQHQQQGKEQQNWGDALRSGCALLLSSRIGGVQKRAGLQLSAAVVALLGSTWLIGPSASPSKPTTAAAGNAATTTSSSTSGGSGSNVAVTALLRVIMEVLSVEMALLLSDAMNPEAVVPDEGQSMLTRPQWRGPEPKTQVQRQEVPAGAAGGEGGAAAGGGGMGEGARAEFKEGEVEEQGRQQQAQEQQQEQAGEEEREVKGGASSGKIPAGVRAAATLPSCYLLMEAIMDVLVEQVQALEAAAEAGNSPQPLHGNHHHHQQQQQQEGVVLNEADCSHLMWRLQEMAKVLLDFLSYVKEERQGAVTLGDPLVLGAVRLLGRFLADVPEAHEAEVQKILPWLLQVG